MKTIDLHTHTVCSDGSMTARELVRHAKESGLSAVAVSDHDSVDGVADALDEGKRIGIEVIPAIELSAQSNTETHILGYFIDTENPALREKLRYARTVRDERQNEICQKLNGLGFAVSMDEVRELAGSDILCRAHFARLMVKKGYVSERVEEIEVEPATETRKAKMKTIRYETLTELGLAYDPVAEEEARQLALAAKKKAAKEKPVEEDF